MVRSRYHFSEVAKPDVPKWFEGGEVFKPVAVVDQEGDVQVEGFEEWQTSLLVALPRHKSYSQIADEREVARASLVWIGVPTHASAAEGV